MLKPTIKCEHCQRAYYTVIFNGVKCCAQCYTTRITIREDYRAMNYEPDDGVSFEEEITRDDRNRSF